MIGKKQKHFHTSAWNWYNMQQFRRPQIQSSKHSFNQNAPVSIPKYNGGKHQMTDIVRFFGEPVSDKKNKLHDHLVAAS